MCSSKIDHATGIVTITSPASWCDVGHELHVVGSAASYGIAPADWIVRLLEPHPRPPSPSPAGAPDPSFAEQVLLEHLRSGEVHPGLVEGLGRGGLCQRGHPLHVDAAGQSRCRTCDAERQRRRRAEAQAQESLVDEPRELAA